MTYVLPGTGSEQLDMPEDRLNPMRNVLLALRQRWWLVLGVLVAVVAVTMWRTAKQPRQYRSQATVRVGEAQAPVSGPTTVSRVDYRVNPVQTEQAVIKSLVVSERVVRRLGLQLAIARPAGLRRSELFGGVAPSIDSLAPGHEYSVRLGVADYTLREDGRVLATAAYGHPVSGGGIAFSVPARPAISESEIALSVLPVTTAGMMVRGGITSRAIPETNIIEIGYTGTDPQTVKDVANAIARAYNDFSSEARRTAAKSRAGFIEEQLGVQRARLEEAQDKLKVFKETQQLSNVAVEQGAIIASIHQFEHERDAALVEQQVYQRLIGRLAEADTTTEELRRLAGTEAIQKNSYISTLYNRWFELISKREELMMGQSKSSANPDVKSAEALIDRVKEDLQRASGHYLQGLQSNIDSRESTIASLRKDLDKYPSLEAKESRLDADQKTLQGVYDRLQSDYQSALITVSGEDAGIRVIDDAKLPVVPIAPVPSRNLVTSLLFGLLLGLASAVMIERLDDSVKSPDELREQMGLVVLGTIPRIRDMVTARRVRAVDAGRLVTHEDPRSPVAEAYRSLRTNLAFARAREAMRVMVLTSPGPSDGKSTTVANLAITFAQQGQRTLIIDADLRRAVLDRLFDVPRSPGLTDVLVGQHTLLDVIHPTQVPNLSVIGSGQFPPNPAELLGSSAMRQVLADAQDQFDIVLVDTPPLLAVTDAAVLSTMVDGAVLVVRVGSTAKTAVRRALAQLQAVNGRLMGGVLNDVDFRQGAFGGTYGYYYYYYYGQDRDRKNGVGMLAPVKRWLTARSGSES